MMVWLVIPILGGVEHALGDWYQDSDGNWYNDDANTPGKVDFGDNQTITNHGGIIAGAPGESGIEGLDGNRVFNNGSIEAGSVGILMIDNAVIENTGTITAGEVGVVADFNATISNSGHIDAGLAGIDVLENSIITNIGTIDAGIMGIMADGINSTIINSGRIKSDFIGIFGSYVSHVANSGAIDAGDTGILVYDASQIVNTGTIKAGQFGMATGFGCRVINSGTVQSDRFGIGLVGTLINSGTFLAEDTAILGHSMLVYGDTLINDNGRIESRTGSSVMLFEGDDTVHARCRPTFKGMIDGGAGNDILRFSRMKGISRAQARALASANPAAGSICIQGETYEWQNFETIETDNLLSYEHDLIDDPGLKKLGHKLDHMKPGVKETTRQGLIFVDNAEGTEETEARLGNLSGRGCSKMTGATAINSTGRVTENLKQQLHQLRLVYQKNRDSTPDTGPHTTARSSFNLNSRLVAYADTDPGAASDMPALTLARFDMPARSAGEPAAQKWHGFATIDLTSAELDTSADPGDYVTSGVTLGGGRLLKDWMTLGLYAGVARTGVDVDPWGSDLESDAALLGLYTMLTMDAWFLSGLAGYTYYEYDMERVIPGVALAESETHGDQFTCSLTAGYDWTIGEQDQWTITPQAGLQYVMLDIDGYTESGADSLNLTVDDQTVYSLRSDLGLQLSRHFQLDWGWAKVNLHGAWIHEFRDEGRGINVRFNDSALGAVRIRTEDEDEDFGIVGLGVMGRLTESENIQFNLAYQTHVGHEDFKYHNLELELRVYF